MANKDNVTQQIRFGLEQLSVSNAAHRFEDMARHIARSRICSNIIPATGPVQVGGDQGRDFESFKTFLSKSSIANSAFVSLSTEKIIVFACSLEKNPERKNGKIENDVNVITSSGSRVEIIYFFSSRDINVSDRHRLREWARNEKKVELEIIDGKAISEWLSDPDIFWIANQYLNIPNEIYPRPDNENDRYKNMLVLWKDRDKTNYSFEEFEEIKSGARYVYKTDELKQDLPTWIKKLELFLDKNVMPLLRMKAIYEICVDTIVSIGNLHGRENLVREYFANFKLINDISSLEDATILLSFISTAYLLNSINISERELRKWKIRLKNKINKILNNTNNPNNICSLLEIKYFSTAMLISKKDRKEIVKNFDKSLEYLERIFVFLPEAPLFPLDRLSDRIKEEIKIFMENQVPVNIARLEAIAQKIDDEFLSIRYGDFKAGQNYKDRAMLYFQNNDIVTAINLLHKAKLKWFSDETLKGSLLTILMLSECYQKLGMNFAAKYYALAAAHISINTGKQELYDYFPRALSKAATCEYGAGSWIGYFDLLESLLIARSIIMKDPLDITKDDNLLSAIYHSTLIKYFNVRFSLQLDQLIDEKLQRLGSTIKGDIETVFDEAKKSFDKLSDNELWNLLNNQLYYKPFNDLGSIRVINWSALGIEWEFSFVNDYKTNAVAEQFIAILQILQVELSNIDLHNVRGKIEIEVSLDNIDTPTFNRIQANADSNWKLKLPNIDREEKEKNWESQKYYVAFALSMIYEFSLIPHTEFYEITEDKFKDGLSGKATIVQPYEVLYKSIIPEAKFNETQKQSFARPFMGKAFQLKATDVLRWKDSISPKYNKKEANRQIKNRYRNSIKPISLTLNKIKGEEWFQSIIRQLKSEGYLDWHLLLAIMNRIINYKIQITVGTITDPNELKCTFKEIVGKPEKSTYIEIPKEILNIEELKTQLMIAFATFVKTWGLEFHNEKINPDMIKEFLDKRFCTMRDDVKHKTIF